ncbi:hypothetical protein F4604DRAFT_448024 [Suillus subluteus]|nr:hypothetical protein F4604DRAFT_448024 [Suillus subluteus]
MVFMTCQSLRKTSWLSSRRMVHSADILAWRRRRFQARTRGWKCRLLKLPDFTDEDYWSASRSPLRNSPRPPADSESSELVLHLAVRLRQSSNAFLLAQQRGKEYKRIVSDYHIIAQVADIACVHSLMDVRTLEILFSCPPEHRPASASRNLIINID